MKILLRHLPRVIPCVLTLSAVTLSVITTPAHPQPAPYPSKPIRVVVPTPAGGPTDVLARIVGQKMTESWNQPVVVENRPGADTIIGNSFVAKSAPDGYTLLVTVDAAVTMHQFEYKKLPYDPAKDFTPIALVANSYVSIIVNSSVPANSLAELIALGKASPGKYSFGWGTLKPRLIVERLSGLAGVKFLDVPYKNSAPTAQALLAGDVSFVSDGLTAYKSNIGKGRFRLVAVTGTQRASAIPDVPTFQELGYPGFDTGVWLGMFGPAGMSAPMVEKINAEVTRILNIRDVRERVEGLGLEVLSRSPQQFADLIRADVDTWGPVIRGIGLTLD